MTVARALATATVMAFAAATGAAAQTSPVKSDEHVVLFNTAAWLDGERWRIPIHGWIHEPVNSLLRKGAIETLLETGYGIQVTEATRSNFDRRVNALLVDNERGKSMVIEVDGARFTLEQSTPNGHFRGVVALDRARAERVVADGLVAYRVVLREDDPRSFTGHSRLEQPRGLSVISDVDDTVKLTDVQVRRNMLERSLLRDFEAVPGMAGLYRAWAERGVTFHFVSSSPWHLYPFLDEFTRDAGFPWATFSLKTVRVLDRTLLDLFRPGTETKPAQIEPLLERYPGRRFVLVGDNGEHDPEVYAQIAARYPEQVARIYIRNVAGEHADDARYRDLFGAPDPARWRLFDDPATLDLPEP